MPKPDDYDPDDPDDVWDHVQETILNAIELEDLETPQLYAAIAVRLLPEFPKLKAVQLALELFIAQNGDANEFEDASIESAKDLLEDIELNPEPPHAPSFAKILQRRIENTGLWLPAAAGSLTNRSRATAEAEAEIDRLLAQD